MEYEYVALSWTEQWPENDERFTRRRCELVNQGWEEYAQASWKDSFGGACIMRRPKDSCKPECCAEEEKCVELSVLPIYNAYLKKTCYNSEQALRLTFLEMQWQLGRGFVWPGK